jgi:hypothetical protein
VHPPNNVRCTCRPTPVAFLNNALFWRLKYTRHIPPSFFLLNEGFYLSSASFGRPRRLIWSSCFPRKDKGRPNCFCVGTVDVVRIVLPQHDASGALGQVRLMPGGLTCQACGKTEGPCAVHSHATRTPCHPLKISPRSHTRPRYSELQLHPGANSTGTSSLLHARPPSLVHTTKTVGAFVGVAPCLGWSSPSSSHQYVSYW